jgi:SLT domain-containing protein/succinate dehydrogenase flavin-adding protein (antitoxin of CptAB toxin-antitoxin module)
MASASDADLAKMVQNYQELQEAQKTTSESMADLETGMSNAMDEIAQNVADSVADMNLSDEAKESAQATIQGFVDGAEGMLPRVQSVFFKIASAASTALAGAGGSYSSNIPGYAVGTESAAPGFAIVGEKGPELVYFNGGETVLTAPETRAAFDEAQKFTQIVSKNALDFAAIQQAAGLSEDSMQTLCYDWTVYNEYEALTANTAAPAEVVPASSFTPSDFTPSEGSPISINFAPVYNFSGVSDTQQFESLLTSHDNDMREYILDVVEEAEHDKFRRAYA